MVGAVVAKCGSNTCHQAWGLVQYPALVIQFGELELLRARCLVAFRFSLGGDVVAVQDAWDLFVE